MTRSPATSLSRIVLVEDGPTHAASRALPSPAVRRYRLACLRLNDPPPRGDRYAHLRRSYD